MRDMATVPASLVAPFPLTTALVPPSPTTLDKLAGMSALAIPLPVTLPSCHLHPQRSTSWLKLRK